jgi:uncharacterized NAD-dependent epimerase/dehydratase family protein
MPALPDAIEAHLRAGRLTNAAIRCAGISINSSSMSAPAWQDYRDRLAAELGLPVVDPMRGGVAALADAITLSRRPS